MADERPVRVERRLTAILAADVAGYSRLMHSDEEGTHARLSDLLAKAVFPALAEHGGRIIKHTGDGFLAEFTSAVEAVRAALLFQTRVEELTIADALDRRIEFRVGINIGDVIVEPHDIFGDGVNIAARLEGIAEPGEVCLSSSAYDQVSGKISADFVDLGEQQFKNIVRPIRAFAAVRVGASQSTQRRGPTPRFHSAPRLSLVVLPFSNIGGDSEQDYFVDGVTESLTTDLSRISGSFVIGRHTAFTFKNKAIDLKAVGRELNVRYVLEGSVQRSGNRLRVNVQLIDAETGNHLWAERFDKRIADLLDMQDEIVSRLANALNTQLIDAEARQAEHSLHPTVLDLYFRGMARWTKSWTPVNMMQAKDFIGRALELDPHNVDSLVGVAAIDTASATLFLVDDPAARLAGAERTLMKALSLAPLHGPAHMFLGIILMATNRVKQGIAECEHALMINPNLADAHGSLGAAKLFDGRAAETEGHVLEALRLSPRDAAAHRWISYVGLAKMQLEQNTDAVDWLRQSIQANPNYPLAYFFLASALTSLGELDDARTAANVGLSLDPTFTLRRFKSFPTSKSETFRTAGRRIFEGMRKAGLPEG